MKIVSWNVNSVRARLENIIEFLEDYQPDIVCFQEIKCVNEQFPLEAFESLGYNCYLHGQKSYNGVAIISKIPVSDIQTNIDNFTDMHSRYIAGHINFNGLRIENKGIEIINCYMPNGNPMNTEKFDYKIDWLQHLVHFIRSKLNNRESFILMGDFNIIPTEYDVHDDKLWVDDALFSNQARALFRELTFMGLVDAVRFFNPDEPCFTFWDYQARSREKDFGIRIDHFLVSPDIADLMTHAYVIDRVRDMPKASDHAPIMLEIM